MRDIGYGESDLRGLVEPSVGFGDSLAVHGDVAGFDESLEAGTIIFGVLLD